MNNTDSAKNVNERRTVDTVELHNGINKEHLVVTFGRRR